MKKIVLLVSAFALVVSMAACSKQPAESGEAVTNENGEIVSQSVAGEGTSGEGENAVVVDEEAIVSVGRSEAVEEKSGSAITRGMTEGTAYSNDSLGIKITPPESFESFADDASGDAAPISNNDYFVIELTENHEGIVYKTVTISITEGTPYSSASDWVAHLESDANANTDYVQAKVIGDVSIGGRAYTCVKNVYPDSPDVYSVSYAAVENGTLVIIGFDQFTDPEIADFFENYITQY